MNFIDIILILLEITAFVGFIFLEVIALKDEEYSFGGGLAITWIVVAGLLLIPFIVIDRHEGATVGTITSVDKNFFGTTAVYIKTIENSEEKYCIENNDLVSIAKENIGKKVRIDYGTRVGLYSTGKCDQSPIDSITAINE